MTAPAGRCRAGAGQRTAARARLRRERQRDALALEMLARLLSGLPIALDSGGSRLLASDLIELVRAEQLRARCASPTCRRARPRRRAISSDGCAPPSRSCRIVVGRWAPPALADETMQPLLDAGATHVAVDPARNTAAARRARQHRHPARAGSRQRGIACVCNAAVNRRRSAARLEPRVARSTRGRAPRDDGRSTSGHPGRRESLQRGPRSAAPRESQGAANRAHCGLCAREAVNRPRARDASARDVCDESRFQEISESRRRRGVSGQRVAAE